MLNEKRVRHMIRMAMYEKYESHEYNKMLNTTKNDYVSFHDTLGTIAGTVLYLLLAGGVVLVCYTFFWDDITQVAVILAAIATLIGYIVFLYVYRRLVHRRSLRRYAGVRRKINRIKKDWEVLEQLYEEEADRAVPQAYAPQRTEA